MITLLITIPTDALMDAALLTGSGSTYTTALQNRMSAIPLAERRMLTRVLNYLYGDGAAVNSPLARVGAAERSRIEALLLPAELLMHRYLFTRTNGSERRHYGKYALQQIRSVARYSCEACHNPDVRVLQLDHRDDNRQNKEDGNFQTLCSNCHQIKSRRENWTGKATAPLAVAVAAAS